MKLTPPRSGLDTQEGQAFLVELCTLVGRASAAPGSIAAEEAARIAADSALSSAIAAAQAASQPVDADLTAIAALATAALGRSLLTGATSAALRSILDLGSVDNTTDADKPVSKTQRQAIDAAFAAAVNLAMSRAATAASGGSTVLEGQVFG